MKNSQPRHVLVYRLSALGDVAMTIPAVYSCATAWPDVTFHVVTSAFCAQLFVNVPANIAVHPVEKGTGTLRLLKQLDKLQIDAVADLHNVLRSWLVDAWFLIRGKRVCMLSKFRDERHAILKQGKRTKMPFVQRYFEVFARLGLPCKHRFTSLFNIMPPLPIEREKGKERWIGIAPFARYENKSYPLKQMQKVALQMANEQDCRVFLFGSCGAQAKTLQRWEMLSPQIHSLAGRFSLEDELALIAHLDAMVSMDSANMHLASLVGTRVVSVWGSTTPACGFLGWGQQESDAVCAHVSCQPCAIGGSRHCRQGALVCLRSIEPETIVKRTKNYI